MIQSPISESEPPHSPSALLASGSSHPPLEKFTVTPLSASNGYSNDVTKSKSTRWYRITKGVAIIVVVAFVLVAVAVGVAVGLTQTKEGSGKNGALRVPNEIQASASSNTGGGGIISTPAGFVPPSSGVVSPTPSPLSTASGPRTGNVPPPISTVG